MLPYHETNQFVKVVQTCNFDNAKKFEWMRGVKESGAKVPREYLAKRVAKATRGPRTRFEHAEQTRNTARGAPKGRL